MLLAAALLLAGSWLVRAQEDWPQSESKFSLARIRYAVPAFRWWGPIGAGNGPPWSHDWPKSEDNLMKIMAEVTKLDVNPGGHITSFESEEVFKFPIAYLCEVGYLQLSDREAHNMREYLLRGGFLIVDDFRGERALDNFRAEMQLVCPDRSLEELPRSHPIFNCFYDISNVYPPPHPVYSRMSLNPKYYGMSDDKGRLIMVIDYDNDISEYWEWSADPFQPIDETNEAFKYGVNYIMYALTH